jgi:hypothetical protein
MKTIKKNILRIVLVLLIVVFYNFTQNSTQQINYSTELIGVWVLNKDTLSKSDFKSNGKRVHFYEGEVVNNSTYSVVNSCKNESLGVGEYFLKSVYDDGDFISCDIINNIHTDSNGVKTLSLTSERGELLVYTKE